MALTEKFIDADGLRKVWTLIKEKFVSKEEGKGLSANDFTDDDKTKLDGIEDGAEKNVAAITKIEGYNKRTGSSTTVEASKGTTTFNLRGGTNIDLEPIGYPIKGYSINCTLEAQDFDEATSSESGLMSASDKTKLDGIEDGADVSKIKQISYNGSNLTPTEDDDKKVEFYAFEGIQADTNGDIIYADEVQNGILPIVAGDNISITRDDSNTYPVIKISGPEPGESYTTATTTSNGLMSKEDKVKLNGIETGAQVNQLTDVTVNGHAQPRVNKVININVPTTESIQSQIDNALVGVYTYAGSVAKASNLPNNLNSTTDVGKVYNIEQDSDYGLAGTNVAWNGTEWDALGISFKVEAMTDQEIQNIYDSVFGS